MTRIGVVDHGAGNLVSIAQGLERVGASVSVAATSQDLVSMDGIVLPGVGTTRCVMDGIDAAGLRPAILEWDRPLLGICVGLQVLFEGSDEDNATCFGFFEGRVKQLKRTPRLPHIGWNDIDVRDDELFADLPVDPTFYFVHSFAPQPIHDDQVIAETTYGDTFAVAVRAGNRVGVQFHPERSAANGLQVLSNFVASCS